jgi:amidophosphoribosyltransferase
MVAAIKQFNPSINGFDVSVFTGEYVTGDIDMEYIEYLEKQRSDSTINRSIPVSEHTIGLYNLQK